MAVQVLMSDKSDQKYESSAAERQWALADLEHEGENGVGNKKLRWIRGLEERGRVGNL